MSALVIDISLDRIRENTYNDMVVHGGGRNQYTGPVYSTKACFMAVGNIITIVNKDRRAWGH